MAAVGRRYLPRGWADFGRQLAIWFGFIFAYQIARGVADRHPERAFANGFRVVNFETHVTHRLYELTFQQFVETRHWLALAVSWTYWNSEFTVVGLTVPLRNTLLLANVLGLIGFVLAPTAPPRMFPELGFVDTLANFGINHNSAIVRADANPYAAMPSLHAADSLIVGIVLAILCRRWWSKLFWIVWPAWVWFAVMATGNHFWLDCVAGLGVALLAMAIVYGPPARRLVAAHRA